MSFFQRLRITSDDVGIKINSRKVLPCGCIERYDESIAYECCITELYHLLYESLAQVLGSILEAYGVNKEQFAPVCVVVDKLDKIGPEAVKEELIAIKVAVLSQLPIYLLFCCCRNCASSHFWCAFCFVYLGVCTQVPGESADKILAVLAAKVMLCQGQGRGCPSMRRPI